MRPWIAAAIGLLLAACAHSGEPAPSHQTPARHVNPANIKRVGRELPPGYEVTSVSGVSAPAAAWGLGVGGAAAPPRCAVLADPMQGHDASTQGISGSGAGGIVYAVVVSAPTGPVTLDRTVVAGCRQWSMTSGRATARIRLVDSPRIEGAQTLGIAADITTSAEGGNEIDSRATTFTAYLGDYYVFTTLIVDPGSPHPPLTPQFAADLLVKAVSALRS